ncbi:MAG TPA: PilZ domain-containing protein [Thermoanaerobaculia bacterium]|nr:PilZ domain-containing protein [Thermoanaerobaculia bacterium]
MPERRRNRRWPRQLEVRFWKQGEEGQGSRAISTNISRTGIFVRTQMVLPSGTRMRLAVGHSGRSFTIEGVVMRALRSPAHLQSVMPSGMGVRFLGPEELLEELLPAIDFQAEEKVLGGIGAPTASVPEEPPAEPARPPSGVHGTIGEPAPAATSPRANATTATTSPRGATAPPSPGAHEAIQPTQLFPLRFRDPDQFRRVFDRDVKTGGLFIHTSRPPALDAVIMVEVGVEGLTVPPIRLQARVVHRMEPPPDSPPGNLLAGMGVQFLDVARAVEQLRALLR